jgi:hypothetical protein
MSPVCRFESTTDFFKPSPKTRTAYQKLTGNSQTAKYRPPLPYVKRNGKHHYFRTPSFPVVRLPGGVAMTSQSFEAWLKYNPAPDLQELVRRFGGYDKITPEAWEEYDRAMAEWQERRRNR